MPEGPVLQTSRLLLRRWRETDLEPFAALNADPEVMEHFPATMSREESDALAQRVEANFERLGYGLWAVEIAANGEFIGFTGLALQSFEAHFTPAVEVGWRLARQSWGHGYATEAARAALAFAFEQVELEEIVSFTATTNLRSQAVMQRIGMTHDPADDFDHPRLPEGDRLQRHVLYRLTSERWRALAEVGYRESTVPQPALRRPAGKIKAWHGRTGPGCVRTPGSSVVLGDRGYSAALVGDRHPGRC